MFTVERKCNKLFRECARRGRRWNEGRLFTFYHFPIHSTSHFHPQNNLRCSIFLSSMWHPCEFFLYSGWKFIVLYINEAAMYVDGMNNLLLAHKKSVKNFLFLFAAPCRHLAKERESKRKMWIYLENDYQPLVVINFFFLHSLPT